MLRFAVLIALLAFASTAKAQIPDDISALREAALKAINADRTERDLGALTLSDTLNTTAQGHARDMLAKGYFAHKAPEGSGARDRFLAAGGSRSVVVGENLAKCEGCDRPDEARIDALQQGWMNSPGHRQNILTSGFDRFGFGIVHVDGRQYAVQTFSGTGDDEGEAIDTARAAELAAQRLSDAAGRAIEPNAKLREALAKQAGLDGRPDLSTLYEALGARNWKSLSLLSAECGGCGKVVTEADVERFVTRWTGSDARLGEANGLGFVILADGAGRKRAFALLGTAR